MSSATCDLLAERRRLLVEVRRLREDNDDLRERLAYAHREIEQLRARLIAVINPSRVADTCVAARDARGSAGAFTVAP